MCVEVGVKEGSRVVVSRVFVTWVDSSEETVSTAAVLVGLRFRLSSGFFTGVLVIV